MEQKALQEDVKLAPAIEEPVIEKEAEQPVKEKEKDKFVAGKRGRPGNIRHQGRRR